MSRGPYPGPHAGACQLLFEAASSGRASWALDIPKPSSSSLEVASSDTALLRKSGGDFFGALFFFGARFFLWLAGVG